MVTVCSRNKWLQQETSNRMDTLIEKKESAEIKTNIVNNNVL